MANQRVHHKSSSESSFDDPRVEFDILHRRSGEILIESAYGRENVAPYGEIAGPQEASRFVNRTLLVRAAPDAKRRSSSLQHIILIRSCRVGLNPSRLRHAIVIRKYEPLRCRMLGPMIAISRWTSRRAFDVLAPWEQPSHERLQFGITRIVADNYLNSESKAFPEARSEVVRKAIQAAAQVLMPPVRWNDNRKGQPSALLLFLAFLT